MGWTVPQYSKAQVNKAGAMLSLTRENQTHMMNTSPLTYYGSLAIINNWRAAHSFPLNTFQIGLRRRGRAIDSNCVVVQRTKRLPSIEHKLQRFPTMNLTQMQDIGGCRAIMNTTLYVERLCESYASSDIKHRLHHKDDYIENPKPSGYKGVHLVYRYFSDKKDSYNGLLIEVQIRSQLQHAWATAVEVVGAFVNQALKSSMGEEDYLRFFALMGSALAVREKSPLVPHTPQNYKELVKELREHARHLGIARKLSAFGTAVKVLENSMSTDDHFFLVVVDHDDKTVSVRGFPQSASTLANDEYLEAEKNAKNGSRLNAVLVSADSMANLQRAYPNYFLDSRLFNSILKETLQSLSVPRKRSVSSKQLPLL